jgi:hypothetical protein
MGPIAVDASETINVIAVAAGFSNSVIATATYTISTPDFMLSPASTNLTVQPGTHEADIITIGPQNGAFGNIVNLSCSVIGPAPLPICALSPTSVTPGAGSPTSTLTITASSVSVMHIQSIEPRLAGSLCVAWLLLGIIGLALFAGPKKDPLRHVWLCCFLMLVLVQAACGVGSSTTQQSSQNYTVTVTGASTTTASSAIQHSTQVIVTVP